MRTSYQPETELVKAVKVFSGLLDCGHAAARTWFCLRAIPRADQGWIDVEVKVIADWMGVTRHTIYRHLSNKIFFPQVHKTESGKVRVYMRSLAQSCVSVGIRSAKELGGCTEFLVEWLGDRASSAIYATELEAQMGQRQAYYKALKLQKEDSDTHIIDPGSAVTMLSKVEKRLKSRLRKTKKETARSEISSTGFNARPFRFFRIRPTQNVPGVTQSEVAQRLKRADRTVRRRLSNRYRARYGIAPLNRRRVLKELHPEVEIRFTEYLAHINANFATVMYGDRLIHIGRVKIGEETYRTYRLLTNIYEFDFELLTSKRARASLKLALKNINTQCPAP